MKRHVINAHVFRGLQTTTSEESTDFPGQSVAQDQRVSEGEISRRAGSVRVSRGTSSGDNLDFTAASSEYVTIPTNAVHALGREWTVRGVWSPDGVSGSQYMLGFGHATVWPIQVRMNDDAVEAVVTDTANATVTLTSTTTYSGGDTIGWQVVRIGTALTLWVNGVSEDTGTMADLDCKVPTTAMYLGRDNAGNYFDGKGDSCWAIEHGLTHHNDWLDRSLDPRADFVLWDYFIQQDANALVWDRSASENHGLAVNTPADAGSTLTNTYAPVQEIKQYRDTDDSRKTLIAIGGSQYNVSL